MQVFEKIIEKLEEQIRIEESIAKGESDGHPITHQYGANCMKVIEKFVRQVAEEYKKDSYFNLDNATLHKCPVCGGNAEHRVNRNGSWACGCFKCKVFKFNYNHGKAVQAWEDFCTEYNNGWIPCNERLPNEEEMKTAYCRNVYGCEFLVTIEGANRPTTLYRTIDGFWVDDERNVYKVIAWQPLPEPYRKGE